MQMNPGSPKSKNLQVVTPGTDLREGVGGLVGLLDFKVTRRLAKPAIQVCICAKAHATSFFNSDPQAIPKIHPGYPLPFVFSGSNHDESPKRNSDLVVSKGIRFQASQNAGKDSLNVSFTTTSWMLQFSGRHPAFTEFSRGFLGRIPGSGEATPFS